MIKQKILEMKNHGIMLNEVIDKSERLRKVHFINTYSSLWISLYTDAIVNYWCVNYWSSFNDKILEARL